MCDVGCKEREKRKWNDLRLLLSYTHTLGVTDRSYYPLPSFSKLNFCCYCVIENSIDIFKFISELPKLVSVTSCLISIIIVLFYPCYYCFCLLLLLLLLLLLFVLVYYYYYYYYYYYFFLVYYYYKFIIIIIIIIIYRFSHKD